MLSIDSKPVHSLSKSFIVSDNVDINPDNLNIESNDLLNNDEIKTNSYNHSDMYVRKFIDDENEKHNERNLHYKLIREDMMQYKPQIINGELIEKIDLRKLPLPKQKISDVNVHNNNLYK